MMKKYRIPVFFLLLGVMNLFCTTSVPPAATPTPMPTPIELPNGVYYVSPDGDDANTGTQSKPWRTIQKAADSVVGGGTVFVKEGNYAERVAVIHSGTADLPLQFEAEGRVVIQGFTIAADYVSIRGFEITDTPDHGRDGWGIWARSSYCVLENNYVHDATRGGILLFVLPGEETQVHDCVVKNNRLYRNAFAGIEVRGRSHLIEGNEVWGTIQIHPKWSNPPNWADADGIRFHGSGHIFRRNYIHDIHYGIPENPRPHIDCFQTFTDGSFHEAASNVVFEQNLCENMQAQSPLEAGKAFMIRDAANLIIRNNILRSYRVLQAIDSDNLQIINNTFTNRLDLSVRNSPAIITLTNTPNSLIKNNIFFDPLLHVIYFADNLSRTGVDIGNNNVFRSDGRAAPGKPYPNDLWNVDPMFLDSERGDFHLKPGSPLIDTGASLAIVPTDYDDDPRPQGSGYDIGSDEWMSDNSFNSDNFLAVFFSFLPSARQ
ncbi:MAG: hypothetical protein DPW18_02985 [Chloroflexi bacterium]|nr:hypothetical protein [Chloroflexota bacterium]MDL1943060.1 DUF1565 domain-containing protein [Chloroflexi bacterium CFX2]